MPDSCTSIASKHRTSNWDAFVNDCNYIESHIAHHCATFIDISSIFHRFPNSRKTWLVCKFLLKHPRARGTQDKILTVFDRIAPLSKHGEPVRALGCTYVFGAALVLIGEVNAVAPLLTMCFLVAYTFMNFSCFVLTYVRSPGFRPAGGALIRCNYCI